MTEALTAVDLGQSFGDRVVFQGVGFTVAQGEIFAIIGRSGCGKSTLLRQLTGLLPLGAGRVTILGHDLAREAEVIRPQIGVLFQSGGLFGGMTLLENVMLPLQMLTTRPAADCAATARAKLAQVGLADAAGMRPAGISGGMAKRAGIARALALDPVLVFLDEPSAGLDPVTAAGLDRLILSLRDTHGTSFVMVTHELASLRAVADRCLMLEGGGVVAVGPPSVLGGSEIPAVRDFFQRRAA